MRRNLPAVAMVSVFSVFAPIAAAHADKGEAAVIRALQGQIAAMQKQLDTLSAKVAAQDKAQGAAPVAVAAQTPPQDQGEAAAPPVETPVVADTKSEADSGVKLTPGGFFETVGLYRSKNEAADVGSNFSASLPFNNSPNAHQGEFRESARQSRLSLLIEGAVDGNMKLSGYVEGDFLGAASTSNSVESNSYTPRLRQGYAAFDDRGDGWHVLAGQAWSLLTQDKVGIAARQENIPLTIDAQYVPGFDWTRNPQIRVVKDFDDNRIAVGLSAESPQVNLGGVTVPGNVSITNTGSSSNFSGNVSTDVAPDLIGKVAYDPGWGHFEAFGLLRFLHDQTAASFHNNTVTAGGGGVSVLLPVVARYLDLQGSFMTGSGIGRYGSAQLPDVAFAPDGSLHPLHENTWLVGAVAHPTAKIDAYLYGGGEMVSRKNETNTSFGYGDFGLNNAGCYAVNGSCSAQTANVWQITSGVWGTVYKGNYGMMRVGAQESFTRRNAFSDANNTAPHSLESITMVSFRYYPF